MNAMTKTTPAITIRTATAEQKRKGLVYWHNSYRGFIDMVKHLNQGAQDVNWAFSPEDVELFKALLMAAAQGKADDFVDILPDGVFAVRFPDFITEQTGFKAFADALVNADIGWGTVESGSLQAASAMLGAGSQAKPTATSERLELAKPATPAKPKADGKTCAVNYGGEINLPNIARVQAVYRPNDPALLAKAQSLFNFFTNAVKSGTDAGQKVAVHSMVAKLAEFGVVRIIVPLWEGDATFKAMETAVERYAPKWFSLKADANFGKSKLYPRQEQVTEQPKVKGGQTAKAIADAKKKARAAAQSAEVHARRALANEDGRLKK